MIAIIPSTRRESVVSRVLFSWFKRAVIYLGRLLPDVSSGSDCGTGKRPTVVPFALLPTGVYRASASRRCWCALTAPLHPYPFQFSVVSYQLSDIHCSRIIVYCSLKKGGIFLWHYPRDHSHWALPSKFGLSGARTFLKLATIWLICNRLRLLSTNTSVVLNYKERQRVEDRRYWQFRVLINTWILTRKPSLNRNYTETACSEL